MLNQLLDRSDSLQRKSALYPQVRPKYADITGRAFVANDDWNMDEPSPSNRWEPFTDKELNTLYAWPLQADVSEIQSIDRKLMDEIAAEIAGRKEKGKISGRNRR